MRHLFLLICFICSFYSIAQVSPLACYPLNGNANDYSGNSFNGSITGAVPATDRRGNSNGCDYFDGSSRIEITYAALFTAQNYTYRMWVKPTGWPVASHSMPFFSLGSTGGDQVIGFNYQYTGSSTGINAGSYSTPSTGTQAEWPVLPSLDMWYHIVAVRETDTLRLYVNNLQLAKTKTVATTVTYGTGTPQGFIGSRFNYSIAVVEELKGYMDDVRIYNSALTPAEVEELYLTNTECDGTTNILASFHQQQNVSIIPNPVQSQTTITIDNNREIDSWTLTNSHGILVHQQIGIRKKSFAIDLSEMTPGIYHLILLDPHGAMYSQKIVKE